MHIKEFDTVLLKDGRKAAIVEVLDDTHFLADVGDSPADWDTIDITVDDIEKKIQIDEMRKEFLSNVSHELKTPIALIQGYAEGLQDNINDDEESRQFYCDVIIDEAGKMNQMVKKLLTLTTVQIIQFQTQQAIRQTVSSRFQAKILHSLRKQP
mgnify:CR=1 FL=1